MEERMDSSKKIKKTLEKQWKLHVTARAVMEKLKASEDIPIWGKDDFMFNEIYNHKNILTEHQF